MKILALYPFLPFPSVSGAKLRGASVLEIVTLEHQVVLASFVARDDLPSLLPDWKIYERFAQPPVAVVRRSEEQLTPAGQELRARLPRPRFGMPESVEAFDSPAMWNRISELDIEQFGAIHIRYVSMAPYALALKAAVPHLRLVIDLDDIPSVLFLRGMSWPERVRQVRMSLWEVKELLRLFAFECGPLRMFDSVWVCSKPDFKKVSKRLGPSRTLVVENVVDAGRLECLDQQNKEQALLFIGDFNYDPNRKGAEFFLREVWPGMRSRLPEMQLWLVGANRHAEMLAWNGRDGVLVTGAVDDLSSYLGRALVSIAPIFVGTGTRIKILEALGAGLPVVTTTIGAEGIEAEDGVHLLIANTAEEFAQHCLNLLQDSALRERLIESGRRLIKEKYDISVMARSVLGCYRLLDDSPVPAPS